ncbi:MAG: Si-specific NAD(P)(+) transhydrogenase [Thiolinea sp.]
MSTRYDLLVIGSGPGGRRAAIQAAKLGKRVLILERGRRIGGVSVHTGTIPSKTLRETVLNLSGWREREFYGRGYRARENISAADLLERLTKTLDHEVETLEHQFNRNQVDTVCGEAHFLDQHTLAVTKEDGDVAEYSAESIVIATGTRPYRPAHIPFDNDRVVDSDEILNLKRIPRSLAVIGAGVIGVEYATIFSALDVHVTLIEPRNSIVDFVDNEITQDLIHQMRDRGMALRLGETVQGIEIKASGICTTHLKSGRMVHSDMVLYTAGRSGATNSLKLENCGLKPDERGKLTVNENFQTEVPHIYAVGDVIGFPSLASTSMEQGRLAACNAFGEAAHSSPEYFPYGIYSVPEISTIGMSEQEVREREIPYECGIARLRETSRGQIMGLNHGILKAIFSMKTHRLLGVHIVGEGATELIHIGQAVLTLEGTLEYFIENAFNYPTLAEAYKIAALDAWNRIHH